MPRIEASSAMTPNTRSESGASAAPDSFHSGRALLAEGAVGADLADGAHDRAFFAAVVDVLLEALECLHLREWTSSVICVVGGEVDEAHAVVELERRVVEPGG